MIVPTKRSRGNSLQRSNSYARSLIDFLPLVAGHGSFEEKLLFHKNDIVIFGGHFKSKLLNFVEFREI